MDNFDNLFQYAKNASEKSYSPYSLFPVGAAILYENGKIYTGCNVENASYGLSLCAERNAMSTAIAQGETSKIKAIAIYSPAQTLCMPCGACRQWLSEFCISEEETKIVLEDKTGNIMVLKLGDIFPYGFKFDK
ncbi:cytidine deaminase [bacterium]|nr:cytidine deaminase [bacterium]